MQRRSTDRGLSEGAAIGVLLGFALFVTVSMGAFVMVSEELNQGPPDANFTFTYNDRAQSLLVEHDEGSEFPAGELVLTGPGNDTTWAVLASVNESTMIGPGEIVLLSEGNAYGARVRPGDNITVYRGYGENRTRLDGWDGETGPFSAIRPARRPGPRAGIPIAAPLSP